VHPALDVRSQSSRPPTRCAAQTITSRNVAPLESAVVSVTTIHSGTAFNVIPQTAELTGTIRSFDPAASDSRFCTDFEQISKGIGEAMGCQVVLDIKRVTPAVINDASISRSCPTSGRTAFPGGEAGYNSHLTMGAEDMAFMQERGAGCFMFVGSNNADRHLGLRSPSPQVDFERWPHFPGAAALMAGNWPQTC